MRRRNLTTIHTYADLRRIQAYWYAISRQDLEHGSVRLGAQAFADWQYEVAEAFDANQTSGISSVQDAFQEWQRNEGVLS